MRATAKWTVAALGAVGAALLGTTPLAGLGRLANVGDTVAALAGLLLGLLGVTWAVWHTTEALTPPISALATLENPGLASLRTEIAKNPEAFFGPFGTSRAELAAARQLHEAVLTKLTVRALKAAAADARANASLAAALQQRLLEFVHVWQVRGALRRARLQTFVGLAVTAVGVVLFLTATSDSRPPTGQPCPAYPTLDGSP
jgi:hypothetical protein